MNLIRCNVLLLILVVSGIVGQLNGNSTSIGIAVDKPGFLDALTPLDFKIKLLNETLETAKKDRINISDQLSHLKAMNLWVIRELWFLGRKVEKLTTNQHQNGSVNYTEVDSSISECGGIVVQDVGELKYEGSPTPGYTCVWTIRGGHHRKIALELLEENFAVSGSKLILMPIVSITAERFHSSTIVTWGPASQGSSYRLWGPAVIVRLTVTGSGILPPKFAIKFSGSEIYHPGFDTIFQHYHFSELNGTIRLDTYKTNAIFTYVILPKVQGPSNVTLTINSVDLLVDSAGCADFLRIFKLAEESFIGDEGHLSKMCRHPGGISFVDNLGWILIVRRGAYSKPGKFDVEFATSDT